MLISSHDKTDLKLDVSVDGTVLKTTERIKIFEVTVDDHVSQMCTKVGEQLNVSQRFKGCFDYKSRMAIYKAFIVSSFIIWL